MIYATFRNFNGNGTNYNTFNIKCNDPAIIDQIKKKENEYHAHMPGHGYTSVKIKTEEYIHNTIIKQLVTDKLKSFIKPKCKFQEDYIRFKTDFQKSEIKKAKSFEFDSQNSRNNNYFYFLALNNIIEEDRVIQAKDNNWKSSFTDEQKMLLRLLEVTESKIYFLDQYELKS